MLLDVLACRARSVSEKQEHAPSRPASPAENSHNSNYLCARSAPTRSPFPPLLGRAPRKEIEKRIKTAIERAAKLRDGAVERVKGESRVRPVGEFERRFVDALE